MKKILFVFSILLFLLGCSKQNSPITDFKDKNVISHLNKSVVALVKIVEPDPFDEEDDFDQDYALRTYCAGVWISDKVFITAKHCTNREFDPVFVGKLVTFKTNDQTNEFIPPKSTGVIPHVGAVIAFHDVYDLSAIAVEETISHEFVTLYTDDIFVGQNVHIVGHPQGLDYSYMSGEVAVPKRIMEDFDDTGKDAAFVQIFAFIWKGNSGGGLFSFDGRLMGITSWMFTSSRINFHIHRDNIIAFCKENKLPCTY